MNVIKKPSITNSELISEGGNYDVIIVRSRTKNHKSNYEKAKKARIIARVGVGLDNIDIGICLLQNNIEVINSPESAINAVAR